MDVEEAPKDTLPEPPPVQLGRGKAMHRLLVALNCGMLILGTTGGPLLSRLYFSKGGHRQWLSAWLETGGWPLLLIPLVASYLSRRSRDPSAPLLLTRSRRILLAAAALGVATGADDFLYAYGLSYVPVSTSAILISTQLAFTVLFAFLIVRQRLTAFSLYGLVLPLVELTYKRAASGGRVVTYALVVEMQLVMGFFATALCTVGMIVNNDFQAIAREARAFELGEARYYTVLVWSSILWQFFFLGAVGVIFCFHTLLTGILIAAFIPVTEMLGVVLLQEKFSSDKGVALVLSLWGLASYSYGEYADAQANKKKAALSQAQAS